jgi:hypothetical protein
LKFQGVDVGFSFMYEKEGWITTKSNLITITDEDNLDIGIQFIDPLYYSIGVKPQIEAMLGMPLNSAMVVTVGKSWASLHDQRLPHGDPGAVTLINEQYVLPDVMGPIYFDETATPNPAFTSTSVDGGVAYLNQPLGEYNLTAMKQGVSYKTVTFRVTQEDQANGVVIYVASPPDSIEGNNDSGPGEN